MAGGQLLAEFDSLDLEKKLIDSRVVFAWEESGGGHWEDCHEHCAFEELAAQHDSWLACHIAI